MPYWLTTRSMRSKRHSPPAQVVLVGSHDRHSRRLVMSSVRAQSLSGCTMATAAGAISGASTLIFIEPGWALETDFAAAIHHQIVVGGHDAVYVDDLHAGRSRPDWSPESLLFGCTVGGALAVSSRCWDGLKQTTVPESVHEVALRLVDAGIGGHHVRAPLTRCPPAVDPLMCEPALSDSDRQRVTSYLSSYEIELRRDGESFVLCSPAERVSLVVPTAGKVGVDGVRYIDRLIHSLEEHPSRHNVDVVAVVGPGVTLPSSDRIQMSAVSYDEPFNFSTACNAGAAHTAGDVVVFINDDVEITSADWLDELVAATRLPGVGAVGPLLLYPDGTVQSAGHVDPGPTTFARGYRMGSGDDKWVEHTLSSRRNTSGLTAACLVMRTAVFETVGGFDPAFPLAFNDVDLGNRIRAHGLRMVYSPARPLVHHESRTRVGGASSDEEALLQSRWPLRHRTGLPDDYLG